MPSETDLRSFPLFEHLAAADLAELFRGSSRHQWLAGKVIFQAGDEVRGLYLLEQGCVDIYRLSPAGQEQILALLTSGQTVAEWALFATGTEERPGPPPRRGEETESAGTVRRYPVSAQCVAHCRVLFIDEASIERQLSRDATLGAKLVHIVSTKLRRSLGLIEDLTLRDSRSRLCRYLSSLLTPGSNAPVVVDLPASQATLACFLGMTGETFSRAVRRLRDEHVLAPAGRQKLEVRDIAALLRLAGIASGGL